jgi:hypothetical protein
MSSIWLLKRFGLARQGNKRLSDATEILLLQNQRPLQQHLYLRPARNVHICTAGKE